MEYTVFFFLMSIVEKHIEKLAMMGRCILKQYFFREKEFVYIYCLNMSKGHVSRYFSCVGITKRIR